MDAIAATVIGGTSLSGGKGYMIGTAFGAVLISSIHNELSILNIKTLWNQVVVGTVILHGSGNVHGPGHGSFLRYGAKLWLVHHMYDGEQGGVAVLQVSPFSWTEDGWPEIWEALRSC